MRRRCDFRANQTSNDFCQDLRAAHHIGDVKPATWLEDANRFLQMRSELL